MVVRFELVSKVEHNSVRYRTLFVFLTVDLSKNTVAVVDDDEDILLSARLFLKRYFQEVLCFSTPKELLKTLPTTGIALVLLDLNYEAGQHDGQEGLAALSTIKAGFPTVEVVVMTAYAEVQLAVNAVKMGAFDFVVKPWQHEKLIVTLMNAIQKRGMENELKHQKALIHTQNKALPPIIGESDALRKIRQLVSQIAPTDAPIHLSGPQGSGKHLIAQHIHQRSARKSQAFVVVDFTNLKSEEQVSYLLNTTNGKNKWDLASGGTLYLKEIERMSTAMQQNLLRLLNEMDTSSIRILSSSSIASASLLHKDLLYQLTTLELEVPSLCERWEDLDDLVDFFTTSFKSRYQKEQLYFNADSTSLLTQYAWPGNVRELKRAIERAVIIAQHELRIEDLLPAFSMNKPSNSVLKLDELEKQHILKVLEKRKGNIQQSANELGISRAALYRRIEKYKLPL